MVTPSSLRACDAENHARWVISPHLAPLLIRSHTDALSSCALYAAKTPANSRIILHTIGERAKELVNTPVPIAPASTPLELIAYTQALILYQTIRIFDGDINLRDDVETGLLPLEAAAFSLMQFTTFEKGTFDPYGTPVEPAPSFEALTDATPPDQVEEFWEKWCVFVITPLRRRLLTKSFRVFQESARRTFITAFFLIRGYQVITGHFDSNNPSCDGKLGLCHSFTMAAGLWSAKDAPQFADAWKKGRHFPVKNAEYVTSSP